jgi:cephalosporin-C deacetylase
VAPGFLDTTSPPFGVFAGFNQIQGPREAVPMPESDHNNVTPQKQGDYCHRAREVLDQIRTMGRFTPDQNWLKN